MLPVGKPSRLARGRRPQLKGVRRDALLTVGTSRPGLHREGQQLKR